MEAKGEREKKETFRSTIYVSLLFPHSAIFRATSLLIPFSSTAVNRPPSSPWPFCPRWPLECTNFIYLDDYEICRCGSLFGHRKMDAMFPKRRRWMLTVFFYRHAMNSFCRYRQPVRITKLSHSAHQTKTFNYNFPTKTNRKMIAGPRYVALRYSREIHPLYFELHGESSKRI